MVQKLGVAFARVAVAHVGSASVATLYQQLVQSLASDHERFDGIGLEKRVIFLIFINF